MKFKKLSKRMRGRDHFTHAVHFNWYVEQEFKTFVDMRNWCWETFGPSVEFPLVEMTNKEVPWCWESIFAPISARSIRIYIKDQQNISLLMLRWSDQFQ